MLFAWHGFNFDGEDGGGVDGMRRREEECGVDFMRDGEGAGGGLVDRPGLLGALRWTWR